MKALLSWIFLVALTLPGFAQFGESALFAAKKVEASLVSDHKAISAGKPFHLALRLVHKPGFHTYWVNPGFGQATQVLWELPEGFTAAPLQWPLPHVKESDVTGNLHYLEGDTLLVAVVTPPPALKDGTTLTFKAKASWQVCDEDSCTPENTSISLTLPAAAEPSLNEAMQGKVAAVLAAQPVVVDAWKIERTSASVTEGEGDDKTAFTQYTYTLTPAEGASADPGKVYFFDPAGIITNDAQKFSAKDGVITLVVKSDAEKKAAPNGFFHAEKGWLKDGGPQAMAESAETPIAAAASSSAPSAAAEVSPAAADRPGEWVVDAGPIDYVEYRDDLTAADLKKGAGGGGSDRGFWTIMGFLFVGGMILNLMPCVFPVLGIKIIGFARLAGNDRSKLIAHALAFTAGVVTFVLLLGGIMLAAKTFMGRDLTWGFVSQNPAGIAGIILLLFVLGLNLWGLFEIGASLTSAGGDLQDKEGLAGAFWSGALTTIVSTPCSGPFLGVAMAYTLSQPPALQMVLLTVFGLGIAFPFAALSTSPKLVKKLPRPGPWMETLKKFLAFPLFAFVIYFMEGFMQQTGTTGTLWLLYAMLIITIAAWIYGQWDTPVKAARTRWIARLAVLLLAAGSLRLVWNASAMKAAETALASGWERWSPLKVRDYRAKKVPVFVDFTTFTCLTCDTNEKNVFHSSGSDQVEATIKSTGTKMLQAKAPAGFSESEEYSAIFKAMKPFQRSGFPTYVIYPSDPDSRPILLPEVITQKMVIHSLTLAGGN